jgi:DNA-binding NarL/FixJ family response regulator
MADKTISLLIAEDQLVARRALAAVFEALPDFDVVGLAADGAEAARLARMEQPHVALLDIKMPRLDGIEAARRIAQDSPKTAIVMLTTFDTEDLIREAILAGAIGYILKDAEEEEVIATVRDAAKGLSRLSPSVARRMIDDFRRLRRPAKAPSAEKLPDGEPLTEREATVLDLISAGKSNRDISQQLGLAEGTVKNHVSSILAKLHARSRTELAVKAVRQGM